AAGDAESLRIIFAGAAAFQGRQEVAIRGAVIAVVLIAVVTLLVTFTDSVSADRCRRGVSRIRLTFQLAVAAAAVSVVVIAVVSGLDADFDKTVAAACRLAGAGRAAGTGVAGVVVPVVTDLAGVQTAVAAASEVFTVIDAVAAADGGVADLNPRFDKTIAAG